MSRLRGIARDLDEMLERLGLQRRHEFRGKHQAVVVRVGESEVTYFFARSTSDRRASLNCQCGLRRKLRELGVDA